MTTQAIKALSIVKTFSGSLTPYADKLLEGDSEDGKLGEPCSFDTNGHVEKRDAAGDLMLGALIKAQQNSATAETDGEESEFMYWTPDCILEGSFEGADAAGSILAQNILGNDYGIKESGVTADRWVVNAADESDVMVRVIKIIDAIGDVYGKVQCVPIAAKCYIGG